MAIDFPTSPVVGQIITGGNGLFYEWDGVAWNIAGNELNRMTFIDYVLTSGGTWVKPIGLRFLELVLVGAGGGSAGCGTTGAGTSSSSGGGGGGAVVEALYTDMSILTSHSYSIGAAGAAGAGTPAAGGAGGDTTFKLLTAGGGTGSNFQAPSASFLASSPGVGGVAASTEPASVIVKLFDGIRGEPGEQAAHSVASVARAGGGGGNGYALPVPTSYLLGAGNSAPIAARFPGGGAQGVVNSVSQANRAGGAGAAGVIYMREWY